MSEASTIHTTPRLGRRNLADNGATLLGRGGHAAVAAAALAPDAELLACCAEAEAIDERSIACCDAVAHLPFGDPRWEAGYDEAAREMPRFHALVARAAELPARTPEGLRAKAWLALSYLDTGSNDPEIALSVARDVLAGRA